MEDNNLLTFDDFMSCDFELLDGNSSVRLLDDWMGNLIEPNPDSNQMDVLESLLPSNSGDNHVLAAEGHVTENKQNKPTFVEVSDQQKNDFIDDMKNKNTVRKTVTVMRQFTNWLAMSPRNETREINTIQADELDNYIGSFLLSIRKSDGEQYEPDTLTSYHRGIDRHLRDKKYPFSLIKDKEFATSRAVLASKRKELKQKGKGNKPNASTPLSLSEEKALKDKNCIGLNSPQQLLNKMWLQNTMLFGIRPGAENHSLRWGDINLHEDENGHEYLEFERERATKTRTGESSDTRSFRPKQFAHPDNPDDCPVEAYKAYRKHRPIKMDYPESPFYLAIHHQRKPGSETWYKGQPLGENSLRAIMKDMASKAELPGKKTNHSARKTTCTKLLHAGVAPTTIQQLTGHKSVESVNNYATASNEMQHHMSDILSNKSGAMNPVNNHALNPINNHSQLPVATPPIGSAVSSSFSASKSSNFSGDIFHGAKLLNCNITINNNYPQCSPKRKRIRVIDSDSD